MTRPASFRSSAHYVSVLETGCQELEALLKLTALHFKTVREVKNPDVKIIAAASADAICQLACIKAYSLLFDNTRKAASLYNLRGEDPLNRSSDDLVRRACEIVMLCNGTEALDSLNAQTLPMDEVLNCEILTEINIERVKALEAGHKEVMDAFTVLAKDATLWELKEVRNLWLAHTSLEAGKWMHVHQFNPHLLEFLKRCSATLRLAVETYKPAVFERIGRQTWYRVNTLRADQKTDSMS
jgi:hypothetical protein